MKPFTKTAAAFLGLLCVAHLVRFLGGLEVTCAGIGVPVWLSAVAAALLGGLSVMVWKESRRP